VVAFLHGGSPFKVWQPDSFRIRLNRRSTFNYSPDILALAALEELEARDWTIGRQWQMRIERAEYEAALAERRYLEVDPSQRLVAATLERRWNAALLQWEELQKQAAQFRQQQTRVATPEQKAKVLTLANQLPQLWHAPTTQPKNRKQMLRLLIKDITVEKSTIPKRLLAHIRRLGNTCTDLIVQLPPNMRIVCDILPKSSTECEKWRAICTMLISPSDSARKDISAPPANHTRRQLSVGFASAIESPPPYFAGPTS
jgi:hypothetical protein